MGSNPQEGEAQLFLVRLWRATGDKDGRWQGKVQHIMSGSAWLFDDTQQIAEIMLAWVRPTGEDDPADSSHGDLGA
jgi:hypothetical protein